MLFIFSVISARNRRTARRTGGWLCTRKYALLPIDARGVAQFDENDIHTDLAHTLEIDEIGRAHV